MKDFLSGKAIIVAKVDQPGTCGYPKSSKCEQHRAYLINCEMYTFQDWPDCMLLERNEKLTMWKSKSSRLS